MTNCGQTLLERIVSARPFLFASLAHLFFALFLFSPFVLEGKVLVASTDNYFVTWINYLFSRGALAQGELGLWNPTIFCGVDFSASPHNHLLGPLDWPLFLLPQHLFLQGLTIQAFLLVFLCGVFGFLFFREELGNARWAFLAALLYQAGEFTFWSITTYSTIQLHTFCIATLYLIWTAHRRRAIVSYALWMPCLAILYAGGNPLYCFAAFVLVMILFVYHYGRASWMLWQRRSSLVSSSESPWEEGRKRREVLAFYGAAATAALLTAPRWLPVAHALLFVGTRVGGMGGIEYAWGRTFHLLRALIPEVFGISFRDSMPYLQALGAGGHTHGQGYSFFGVAGVLCVILALVLRVPKARFWLWFLLLSSAWLVVFPPLSAVLNLLAYPMNHMILPRFMIPIAFCAVAGHAAAYLEANWDRVAAKIHRPLFGIIGLVALLAITVWAIYQTFLIYGPGANPVEAPAHRQALMRAKGEALACVAFLLAVGNLIVRSAGQKRWSPWLVAGVAPGAVLLLYWLSTRGQQFANPLYRSSFLFLTISSVSALLFLLVYLAFERGLLSRGIFHLCCLMLVLGAAGVSLAPTLVEGQLTSRQITLTLGFGTFKFLVLGLGMVYLLLSMSRRPDLRPVLLSSLCTLLLIDLLPSNKNYSRQIREPFAHLERLYPQANDVFSPATFRSAEEQRFAEPKATLNLHLYRLNHPHLALRLWSTEIQTNIPGLYGVRSYGGVNSDVPRRLAELIARFRPAAIHATAVDTFLTDSTLLDVLGCGYDLGSAGQIIERPTALARFMLFHRSRVVPEDKQLLDRLAAKDFVPRDQLLLEHDPGIELPVHGPQAEFVDYASPKTSELHISCDSPAPALLFFGDSYDPGWEARVNGRKVTIQRADYSFMAVPVPAGKSEVVFQFRPRPFIAGLAISGCGLVLFLGALLAAWRRRRAATALPAPETLVEGERKLLNAA
jgi:hypothetical protein